MKRQLSCIAVVIICLVFCLPDAFAGVMYDEARFCEGLKAGTLRLEPVDAPIMLNANQVREEFALLEASLAEYTDAYNMQPANELFQNSPPMIGFAGDTTEDYFSVIKASDDGRLLLIRYKAVLALYDNTTQILRTIKPVSGLIYSEDENERLLCLFAALANAGLFNECYFSADGHYLLINLESFGSMCGKHIHNKLLVNTDTGYFNYLFQAPLLSDTLSIGRKNDEAEKKPKYSLAVFDSVEPVVYYQEIHKKPWETFFFSVNLETSEKRVLVHEEASYDNISSFVIFTDQSHVYASGSNNDAIIYQKGTVSSFDKYRLFDDMIKTWQLDVKGNMMLYYAVAWFNLDDLIPERFISLFSFDEMMTQQINHVVGIYVGTDGEMKLVDVDTNDVMESGTQYYAYQKDNNVLLPMKGILSPDGNFALFIAKEEEVRSLFLYDVKAQQITRVPIKTENYDIATYCEDMQWLTNGQVCIYTHRGYCSFTFEMGE